MDDFAGIQIILFIPPLNLSVYSVYLSYQFIMFTKITSRTRSNQVREYIFAAKTFRIDVIYVQFNAIFNTASSAVYALKPISLENDKTTRDY